METKQIGFGRTFAAVFLAILLAVALIGGFLYARGVALESQRARQETAKILFEAARHRQSDKNADYQISDELFEERLRQIDEAEKAGKSVPPEFPEYSPPDKKL